jgi:hypothetical protein
LASDEHLLWSGVPRQGVRLCAGDMLLIPFSLLWGGFALFWEWSVIRDGASFVFILFGLPFVLVAVYLLVGRFYWDAYRRANTCYGVSDRRVLIVSRGLVSGGKSLDLRGLADISLSGSPAGPGVIRFGGTHAGAPSLFANMGWPGMPVLPMFELADGTKRVYELIRQAQLKIS